MKRKFYFVILSVFLLVSINGSAQQDIYLSITNKLGDDPFVFLQTSTNDIGQDFKISRVDYYLSGLKIIHDGGMETEATDVYILAKGNSNVSVLLGNFDLTNVEGIKFSVGVDAPINNEDPAQWQAGHPLAPQSPSMHWGWAAGYRFVALEGMAGTDFNTSFQMHGLGNSNYFEQTVMSTATAIDDALYINLDADYKEAVNGIDLNAGPIDHGMNNTDLIVLENFRDYVFSPSAGGTSGIADPEKVSVNVYPNPSSGVVRVNWNETNVVVSDILVYDITGRIIQKHKVRGLSEMNLNLEETGIYLVQLQNSGELLSNSKLVIQ